MTYRSRTGATGIIPAEGGGYYTGGATSETEEQKALRELGYVPAEGITERGLLSGAFGAGGFISALSEYEGNPNFVWLGNQLMAKNVLLGALSAPGGREWMADITPEDLSPAVPLDIKGQPLFGVNRFGEPLPGPPGRYGIPPIEAKLAKLSTLATRAGVPGWDGGGGIPAYGGYGQPTTRYGAGVVEPEPWYPPARWGRPIEEVTEYARPEYEPAYYEMLEKAKPTVSPARYEWMESLRPELLRQWQAGRPVSEAEFARKPYTTEYEVAPVTSEEMAARVKELSKTMTLEAAEEQASAWAKGQLQRRALTAEEKARTGAAGLAKVAAQQRQAKWGAWTGIYPFKEEWYRMGQRERGIYPARFAPTARWTV